MTTINIKKEEYNRLKKLDKSFGKMFDYFAYLYDIGVARKEIKEKKTIPQNKLFKKFGI